MDWNETGEFLEAWKTSLPGGDRIAAIDFERDAVILEWTFTAREKYQLRHCLPLTEMRRHCGGGDFGRMISAEMKRDMLEHVRKSELDAKPSGNGRGG